MQVYLDFEKPLVDLKEKIRDLREYSTDNVDFSGDIAKLEKKAEKLRTDIFSNLNRWQRTQLARHQNRPYTLDYIENMFTDWFEVHGDRNFRDDPALVCGFARFNGEPCAIIGHQKGRDTKSKVHRNFGMPNPEGYRKALRVMEMAEQFGLPIRNLLAGASRANFSIPGSLLGATVDNTHPLAYGMPANASLNFVNGGAFDVLGQSGCTDDLLNLRHCSEVTRGWRPLHESEPVSRYESIVNFTTDAETVLMSGWAHGTEHIAGKSAMAQVPQGEGSVVLFAFRPQFRGQPRGTYKLVFNALHGATVD